MLHYLLHFRCYRGKIDWWQTEKQAIEDEANRKRSEAQAGIPKAEARERSAIECRTTFNHPGQTAKATAAKVNTGAVARGDKLAKERPDLAACSPQLTS